MLWLAAGGLVLLTVYEVWAAISHKAPTLSQWIWALSARSPIIPFLFGLLMGHFFARALSH